MPNKVPCLILVCGFIFLGFAVIFRFGFNQGYDEGHNKGYQDGKRVAQQEMQSAIGTFSTDGLWELINYYRETKGLVTLTIDSGLCNLAEDRAKEIVSDWSHVGFYERSNTELLYNSYCPRCKRIGENLAKDFYTPQDILDEWLKSPVHKELLDYPFNVGCIAIHKEKDNFFVVLELGKR